MSANPPIADMSVRIANCSNVPKADVCRRSRGGHKPERAEGAQGIPDFHDLKVNSLVPLFFLRVLATPDA